MKQIHFIAFSFFVFYTVYGNVDKEKILIKLNSMTLCTSQTIESPKFDINDSNYNLYLAYENELSKFIDILDNNFVVEDEVDVSMIGNIYSRLYKIILIEHELQIKKSLLTIFNSFVSSTILKWKTVDKLIASISIINETELEFIFDNAFFDTSESYDFLYNEQNCAFNYITFLKPILRNIKSKINLCSNNISTDVRCNVIKHFMNLEDQYGFVDIQIFSQFKYKILMLTYKCNLKDFVYSTYELSRKQKEAYYSTSIIEITSLFFSILSILSVIIWSLWEKVLSCCISQQKKKLLNPIT